MPQTCRAIRTIARVGGGENRSRGVPEVNVCGAEIRGSGARRPPAEVSRIYLAVARTRSSAATGMGGFRTAG